MSSTPYAVIIPTLGRPSLDDCLAALAEGAGPLAQRIVLVDDRPPAEGGGTPLRIPWQLVERTVVLRGGGNGPAAARNTGWQAADEEWIAFLDDDTIPSPTWARDLVADLARAAPDVAGVQGRITVPLPADRRPTDWERCTAGLADSRWITADMAYRRAALQQVKGFDERFRRAYREDADIALRMLDAGWRLEHGLRETVHPVRPSDFWVSVRTQAGNADDVLMRRLHGPHWRSDAGAPRGRLPRHLAITAAAVTSVAFTAARAKRPAAVAGGLWLAGVAEFTWARVRPGPRTPGELAKMAVTSAVIPVAATRHWIRGRIAHRDAPTWTRTSSDLANIHNNRFKSMLRDTLRNMKRTGGGGSRTVAPADQAGGAAEAGEAGGPWVLHHVRAGERSTAQPRNGNGAGTGTPTAVLFDRDGTLVDDVPYNGDPAAVRLRPGAVEAVEALRAQGVAIGVVTNQSGIARGFVTPRQVEAVHRRIEELIGPLDVWAICPHGPDDGCGCRKPAPGLVLAAAEALGVPASTVVVVGDIGADVRAAEAAGATGIIVPTPATRPEETAAAARSARTLLEATRSLLPEKALGDVQ